MVTLPWKAVEGDTTDMVKSEPLELRPLEITVAPLAVHFLAGGIPTPLKKYEFVSWDDEIPN